MTILIHLHADDDVRLDHKLPVSIKFIAIDDGDQSWREESKYETEYIADQVRQFEQRVRDNEDNKYYR